MFSSADKSAPSLFESQTKKEKQCQSITSLFGGELGIRTLGTLRTQHFECCTFDLSDNSPYIVFEIRQHIFKLIYSTTDILSKNLAVVNK